MMKKLTFLFFVFLYNSIFSITDITFLKLKGIGQTTDSIVSSGYNNVITFNPLQLYVGELRISLEKQITETKYNIFGVGVSYYPYNVYADARSCHDYKGYGVKLFYGRKNMMNKFKYWSYVVFAKYEHDDNIKLGPCIFDRYKFEEICYSNILFKVLTKEKFVLGTKLMIEFQNSQNSKIVYAFYAGVGIRLKYFIYPSSVDRTKLSYVDKGIIIPSVHLGYKIGYNFKKIKECE